MQFYFVTAPVTLSRANKKLTLTPPPKEQLSAGKIESSYVRCGFVAWEVIHARKLIGHNNVITMLEQPELIKGLPKKILPYDVHGGLISQIATMIDARKARALSRPIRIAIINGFGTMLGDNLIGLSALEILLGKIQEDVKLPIEITLFLAWNSATGVESLASNSPFIKEQHVRSTTIEELSTFDAYWDFSALLTLNGYSRQNLHDFYLNQLAIDAKAIPEDLKIPVIRVSGSAYRETKERFKTLALKTPKIFIQFSASNPARSVPLECQRPFLIKILEATNASIYVADTTGTMTELANENLVTNLGAYTEQSIDKYISVINTCDLVVSVDTFALHIAIGLKKPGIGLFSLSNPGLRLTYAIKMKGFLIPGADALPYWDRHKSDDLWESSEKLYIDAWKKLDFDNIIHFVKQGLDYVTLHSN